MSEPSPPHLAAAVAERRHLTVMFCDMVGSTELARRLDPEDFREVLRDFLDVCSRAIAAYGGEIAQLLGDGVLAYFGYPQAHEDDPVRAVDASLGILAELPTLDARLASRGMELATLAARIGVHTGLVVVSEVGSGAHRERLALGDTVNMAARLQGAADPNTVLISDATRELVRGAFALEDIGMRPLKGIARPVPLTRVVKAGIARHRLDRSPESQHTPFVGRQVELGSLLDCWRRVTTGRRQVALVQGEAGIGKSRLLRVFRSQIDAAPHFWLEGRCSSFHGNSAFYPLVQLLKRALGMSADEPPERRTAELERWLEAGALDLVESVPVFGELLDLPLPDRYPSNPLHPEVQRKRILDLVPRWLAGLAERQPVVVVIEDLHWSDPSTLELIETFLGSRAGSGHILLLLTFRPEFQPSWDRARHAELIVAPLDREHAAALARNVARGKTLPPEILEAVVEKTDGVPLFVEELTKNLLESEQLVEEDRVYRRTGPELAIPSTLQGSLLARLDRLGPAKEVAQLASVVGREFAVDLIAAVSPWPRSALERTLGQLERSGIVRRSGSGGGLYTFEHALIQDAAYQSLLRSGRRDFHARIAEALETRFPELVEAEPEVIARHCELAGKAQKASAYYERAGRRAIDRSAHTEAAAQLQRGLDLVATLDEGPDRRHQELSLLNALGTVLLAARGYANREVELCHERARLLCREIGDSAQLFQSLSGLFLFYVTRGDLEPASELAAEIHRLAERLGGNYYAQWAHLFRGMPLHYRGRWRPALDHFEAAVALYDGSWQLPDGLFVETDPGLACRCMAGQALWMLGWPDRGLARTREAVEIARRSLGPNNLAFALVFSTTIHQMRREPEAALEDASEVIRISEEHRFPMWLGMGRVFRGWALAETNEGERALAEIIEGLSLLATTGARLTGPQILGLLGQVYLDLGRFPEAAGAIESGLRIARDAGIEFWNPELHRLRGEILLHIDHGSGEESESCFRRAREIADAEAALSLALRAAISGARQLRTRGRIGEARAWLGEAYQRLPEGHATRDVLEARALLAELGAAPLPVAPSA